MSSNFAILQPRIKFEIRPSVVRSGRAKLVNYDDRFNHLGFISVYGYAEDAQQAINQTGTTKKLSKFPVYSDILFVDFDDNEEAAEEFKIYLDSKTYSYDMYHSGGRSIHFHIPIEPMYGVTVPQAQKSWMENHAPSADMTIYRHSAIYRLPGTYHAKNPGKKKELLYSSKAENILYIENRPIVHTPKNMALDDLNVEEAHDILGKLLNTKVEAGNRHKHAFKIATMSKLSDKNRDYSLHLLTRWNENNCFPPKYDWELEKLISWVYND